MTEFVFHTRSPRETQALAARLARALPRRAVIALHGNLGSGKTCFVQGLAHGMGFVRPVTSPTFTLVNEYRGAHRLVHVDLYRVRNPDETISLGLDEHFEQDCLCAVEWPERLGELLPSHTVHVHMEQGRTPAARTLRVEAPASLAAAIETIKTPR